MVARSLAAFAFALAAVACRPEDDEARARPLPAADVDRACLRIASCSAPGSETASACVAAALFRPGAGRRFTEEWIDCLDAAGADCSAVASCAPEAASGQCAGIEDGTLCEGDTAVACWAGQVESTLDCAEWGLSCGQADGRSMCRGNGRSCLEGSDSCDGVAAVMCLGYREARLDCSRLTDGRRCEVASGRAACVAGGSSCDGATFVSRCDGDGVVLCSSTGSLATLSCPELGFGSCIDEPEGARCTLP